MNHEKKRCLVTGASGLIGKEFLKCLDYEDIDLYVICRKKDAATINGVNYIYLDLNEDWDSNLLPQEMDIVVHMAQSEHHRMFPDYADEMLKVNTIATFKLLEYARAAEVKKFILISSGGVYGNGVEDFIESKELAIKPLGFYIGTKICSEVMVQSYNEFFKIIVLRPFFVYGKGQRNEMLIPRLVESIKTKTPIVLAGQNGITINPIYSTDAATALLSAVNLNDSMKINIAGPESITLREICNIIGNYIDVKPIFKTNMDIKSDNCIGNINIMKQYLCEPRIKFIDGIQLMLKGEE